MRRRTRLAAVAAGLLAALPPEPAFANPVLEAKGVVVGRGAEIRLDGGPPVTSIEHPGPRELVVRFAGAVDSSQSLMLLDMLPDAVADVQFGHDSLLIGLAADYQVDIQLRATGVAIALKLSVATPRRAPRDAAVASASALPADAVGADPDARADDDVVMSVLYGRWLAARDEGEAARAHLGRTIDRFPERPGARAAFGDVTRRTGRWREALAAYDRSLALQPQNEFVAEAREDLLDRHRPQANASATYRDAGPDDSRVVGRLDVGDHAAERYKIEAGIDYTLPWIENVRRVDGAIEDADGLVVRGAFALRRERINGDLASALLFAGDGGPGIGAGYDHIRVSSETNLRVSFLEPTWEFAETLAQGGTVDRVEVAHSRTLEGFFLSGRAGLRNYRIDHESWASTAALGGTVSYTFENALTLGKRAFDVTPVYLLDASYPLNVRDKVVQGGTFEPVPATEREVHTLEIALAWQETPDLEVRTRTGYSIDRFGGSGASVYADAFWSLGADWLLRGTLGRSINLTDTETPVYTIGLGLTWRYAETPDSGLRQVLGF